MIDGPVVSSVTEYTVERSFADGRHDIVCDEVDAIHAAKEFWRCTRNVSALSGVVEEVVILDGMGQINVAWHYGHGYTYDGGKTYRSTPATDERIRQ